MIRGTTPTFTLDVEGIDLTDKKIVVTLEQDETELDIQNPHCAESESGCTITFDLSQEQTLMFRSGRASIQVRWINEEGSAGATNVATFSVGKVLKEGEVNYE